MVMARAARAKELATKGYTLLEKGYWDTVEELGEKMAEPALFHASLSI